MATATRKIASRTHKAAHRVSEAANEFLSGGRWYGRGSLPKGKTIERQFKRYSGQVLTEIKDKPFLSALIFSSVVLGLVKLVNYIRED